MTRAAIVLLGALAVSGAEISAQAIPPRASADSSATDRRWTVDVAQKQIVESSFSDAASVVASDEEGRWYVCAGAAVTADQVRISLTNVQADVRLRADLAELRSLFERLGELAVTAEGSTGEATSQTGCESSNGQTPVNLSPDQMPSRP